MWGILVALLSGALMSVQGVFNTALTKQTSLWVSTGWVQISAFLVCIAAWLFTGRDKITDLARVDHKYILLGGVIGAFITVTVIQSMSRSYAHRNSTACSGIPDRGFRCLWGGKSRI